MRLPRLPFLILAWLTAGTAAATDGGPIAAELDVLPETLHERCLQLATGQSVAVDFNASPALDFSIQLESQERHYLLARNNAKALKREFRAPHGGSFCFEWKNMGRRASHLGYRLRVSPAPAGSPPAPPR